MSLARTDPISRTLPPRVVLSALLAAALTGAVIGLGGALVVGAGVALVLLPFFASRPHLAIYVLSVWVPLQYWITKDLAILPRAFVWIDELLVVLLAGVVVLRALVRGRWRRTPLDVPLLVFCACALVSSVANQVSPIIAVLGVRDILQYVVVFYALAALPLHERWDRHWVHAAFAIGIFQAPLAITQARTFFATQGARIDQGDYDLMIGTFGPGGGDFLAYFITFLLLVAFGQLRHRGVRVLWVVPVLLIPFIFSTSRMCFLFLPLGLFWLFRQEILEKPSRLLLPLLAVIVAFGGLVVYYWNDPQVMRIVLDPARIVESQFEVDATYAGRIIHYPIAYMILRDMSVSPLLGTGPGMYLGPTASFFMVPITQMFYDMFGRDPAGGRFGAVDSGYLEILVPYGVLGFLAFTFLVARVHGIAKRLEQRARTAVGRGFGRSFRAIVLFLVVGSLAAPVWEVQTLSFYFWLFAGIAYRVGRREGLFA